ncbi:molybdopterin molybdotransferase MoeA [Leucobacter sp. cx-328]|uniref:molybdopterin molybdotransferase MoeA n=1 Tax=unclassified Leucobacter TaxID=2621730 RepID=UPI00165E683A|nr:MULTISPECIES: gephyrin-like molybdotransferase Glp [unclassified Leucobacter]MBC9944224.1 molybdopterin molybdotransferase MoeA [Leucobacter sp. cx-328]
MAGTESLIPAADHLKWILAEVPRLSVESVPLREAHGRTLAADVAAQHDLPLWDNSAMDGYAVRAVDLAAASATAPVGLRIIGEVAAGSAADPAIAPGECVRIMTGAPLPTDADAIVPVEAGVGKDGPGEWAHDSVSFSAVPRPGAHVRRRGEDVTADMSIAAAGDPLTAMRIAALAAAGVGSVAVHRAPRVAVIATGSELQAPGTQLARGQISESNSLLIVSLLAEAGIGAIVHAVSADDPDSFGARISHLASEVDVIITTGGVGPGAHDIVRIALAAEPEVRAVRVAVKPGQPQCAGRLAGGAWIFALPGNPGSAATSFELFVRPALLRMQGRTVVDRVRVPVRAGVDWRGSRGRLQVLPIRLEASEAGLECVPAVHERRVSHAVSSGGGAAGYALVPPEHGDVRAGDVVDVILVGGAV